MDSLQSVLGYHLELYAERGWENTLQCCLDACLEYNLLLERIAVLEWGLKFEAAKIIAQRRDWLGTWIRSVIETHVPPPVDKESESER